jgi:hypothetical protein
MQVNIRPDDLTKAKIVYMILNRKTEEALQNLSQFYNITPPEIVVGTIKVKRKSVYAVYVQKESKISPREISEFQDRRSNLPFL